LNIYDLKVAVIGVIDELAIVLELTGLHFIKILRILRVVRLIRSLFYMKLIVKLAKKILAPIFSIMILLLLFINIYAIMGIKFYK